eukprot:4219161-Prymnesium_polylepis.1
MCALSVSTCRHSQVRPRLLLDPTARGRRLGPRGSGLPLWYRCDTIHARKAGDAPQRWPAHIGPPCCICDGHREH